MTWGRLTATLAGLATANSYASVAQSNVSGPLVAALAARKTTLVWNESTSILYLFYGTTASASRYSVQIAPGGFWEMPRNQWGGKIDCVWGTSGAGNARVSDLS